MNTSLINPNVTSGNYFGNDDYESTIGNSNYNALQVTVRSQTKYLTYSLGYTWSKSIDQASSISDVADPYNFNATRGLSAWNMNQNFVATYDFRLPLERLTHRAHFLLEGWGVSGITRVGTGFPVTLSTGQDNSLQGSSPNGVNNRYLDMPDVTGAPLNLNSHPQTNGLVYFNPAAFQLNALGTVGNAGRREFSGPGLFNTDLVVRRNFQIREAQALQFRVEMFNVFNTTQFFGSERRGRNRGHSTVRPGDKLAAAPPDPTGLEVHLLKIASKVADGVACDPYVRRRAFLSRSSQNEIREIRNQA